MMLEELFYNKVNIFGVSYLFTCIILKSYSLAVELTSIWEIPFSMELPTSGISVGVGLTIIFSLLFCYLLCVIFRTLSEVIARIVVY